MSVQLFAALILTNSLKTNAGHTGAETPKARSIWATCATLYLGGIRQICLHQRLSSFLSIPGAPSHEIRLSRFAIPPTIRPAAARSSANGRRAARGPCAPRDSPLPPHSAPLPAGQFAPRDVEICIYDFADTLAGVPNEPSDNINAHGRQVDHTCWKGPTTDPPHRIGLFLDHDPDRVLVRRLQRSLWTCPAW
jgi:hypothetical protein